MRNRLFVLALLMFIFAFQFSAFGLATFAEAYEIDWKRSGYVGWGNTFEITWVLNWGKYLNALLWWWGFWAPIILLTLYCGIKEPKAECKIKSPALFAIGLILVALSFIIAILGGGAGVYGLIQFVTKGYITTEITEEITNANASELFCLIKFGEELGRMFVLLIALCWFIGTFLICESIE